MIPLCDYFSPVVKSFRQVVSSSLLTNWCVYLWFVFLVHMDEILILEKEFIIPLFYLMAFYNIKHSTSLYSRRL